MKVSIICITYNQKEYIEKAIESFLNQDTNFQYEIIIHDDASTDGTLQILENYQEMYPDVIKIIAEKENKYSRNISFVKELHQVARGKYIAICEGDDYWCDSTKLQKQFDYMEDHPNCSLYLHNGFMLNEKTKVKTIMNPFPKSMILSNEEVIKENKTMPPTASSFYKKADVLQMPDWMWNQMTGDRVRRLYLITKGYAYYSDDCMCTFRFLVPNSFGDRVSKNKKYREDILKGMIEFLSKYDEYTNYKYKDEISYAKSREYFHFWLREGNRREAVKTDYFKENYDFIHKIYWYIRAILKM